MSSTTVKRKQYVITYMSSDIAGHGTVTSERAVPEGLRKFIDSISGDDLKVLLPVAEQVQRTDIYGTAQYALITRRAAARRLVQVLREARTHGHDQYKLIEVGEFKREVKPVKHWNIERSYRDVGKGNKWVHDTMPYARGIQLREDARQIAARYQQEYNAALPTRQYKFRAVAVYA